MSGSRIERIDGLTVQRPFTSDEKLDGPGPYVALIRDAVEEAVRSGASDIHFEPTAEGIQIRVRIAGILENFHISGQNKIASLTAVTLRRAFFTELKRVSNLSLGAFGIAQDSRISFPTRGIEVRVNLIPTIHGEKVVYRLFFKNSAFDLSKTGYNPDALRDIRSVIGKSSGLIVISGETGSGKSTTLYSILNELDRTVLNISSLEDPVEHVFLGVNHTQVSSRLKFADGLRALLRQDPDVILVGEIRDQETAKLVNRAAQTGHLVLTTVHTNRALTIPAVFEFYGVKAEEVVPNILLGANQRLVSKLCNDCRETASERSGFFRANRNGCPSCRGGFQRTRQVLFEYFINTESSLDLNLKRSLEQEVLEHAKSGTLSIDDVLDHCDARVFFDGANRGG